MSKYLYFVLFAFSCGSKVHKESLNTVINNAVVYRTIHEAIEDTIAGVQVTLIQDFQDSSNSGATILVLPGWDFERHRWLKETSLRALAKTRHYRLILPEMRRSIYTTMFYPETTLEARQEKTGKWLIDTFIPAIQKKYNLLTPRARNFVLGLSTGGRGAFYCAWKAPFVFIAAASLSGDFNQSKMPTDFLMKSVYGDYERNKVRWDTEDNLYRVAESIVQPLFIAHGKADKVVPFGQSLAFATKTQRTNAKVKTYFVKEATHDFKFWNSALEPAINFFDEIKESF